MSILQRSHLLAETLPLAFRDTGSGPVFLILHGGAGPTSMAGLGDALAGGHRIVAPVHPGFDEEPRPDWFHTIDDLAIAYLALIERLALDDVVLVGNSVGGWIAAEMALRQSPRVAGIVLINAVGIDTGSPDTVIVDPMNVPPAERAALAFHDPARFSAVPPTPEALARLMRNQQVLRVYAGEPFMHDPALRDRLGSLDIPALVAWGEGDRIVEAAYGRRLADSMPAARFELIAEAGHFPQIEKPDIVRALVEDFSSGCRARR